MRELVLQKRFLGSQGSLIDKKSEEEKNTNEVTTNEKESNDDPNNDYCPRIELFKIRPSNSHSRSSGYPKVEPYSPAHSGSESDLEEQPFSVIELI